MYDCRFWALVSPRLYRKSLEWQSRSELENFLTVLRPIGERADESQEIKGQTAEHLQNNGGKQ
jgi:hypothetical protein